MRIHSSTATPIDHLIKERPDHAVMYFCPQTLQKTAERFQSGFDGLVTYAVKANPREEVLENLTAAGIRAFDVASPMEMRAARAACGEAVLHYNNPVRSLREIEIASDMEVASYSLDCPAELDKLGGISLNSEISVRLALPVPGAAYDFGEKFGVGPSKAQDLLARVKKRGFQAAITFHPGTQCDDPAAWAAYIDVCAEVARKSGVAIERLNVGGGFAAHRSGAAPNLEGIFDAIATSTRRAFGEYAPELICEPGRAMVSEAFVLATRVKAIRGDGSVFLNDGIYGAFCEMRDIEMTDRIKVISPNGHIRRDRKSPRVVYGPTCDSLDRLPQPIEFAEDIAQGDYVLFEGMGAYTLAMASRFNGYGIGEIVTVERF